MRPHENGYGIVLETTDEVRTAQECFDISARYFRAGAEQMENATPEEVASYLGYASNFDDCSQMLTDQLELHELGDASEELSIMFPDAYSDEIFDTILKIGAREHPSEEIRTKASNMTFSYLGHTSLKATPEGTLSLDDILVGEDEPQTDDDNS